MKHPYYISAKQAQRRERERLEREALEHITRPRVKDLARRVLPVLTDGGKSNGAQ